MKSDKTELNHGFCVYTNRERLDVPLNHVLLGNPLGAACGGLELG